MKNRGEVPEVNAGSMADIAFLLLIFFLVTTSIETDVGLNRLLPRIEPQPQVVYPERNILVVDLNQSNQIMVDKKIVELKDLKKLAITFLDNGGAPKNSEDYCDYCQGLRSDTSSDTPIKAIISLSSSRETSYATYIAVQNELVAAYNALRNREAVRLFNMEYINMEKLYDNEGTSTVERAKLKARITSIRELYPQKILEAEIN